MVRYGKNIHAVAPYFSPGRRAYVTGYLRNKSNSDAPQTKDQMKGIMAKFQPQIEYADDFANRNAYFKSTGVLHAPMARPKHFRKSPGLKAFWKQREEALQEEAAQVAPQPPPPPPPMPPVARRARPQQSTVSAPKPNAAAAEVLQRRVQSQARAADKKAANAAREAAAAAQPPPQNIKPTVTQQEILNEIETLSPGDYSKVTTEELTEFITELEAYVVIAVRQYQVSTNEATRNRLQSDMKKAIIRTGALITLRSLKQRGEQNAQPPAPAPPPPPPPPPPPAPAPAPIASTAITEAEAKVAKRKKEVEYYEKEVDSAKHVIDNLSRGASSKSVIVAQDRQNEVVAKLKRFKNHLKKATRTLAQLKENQQ